MGLLSYRADADSSTGERVEQPPPPHSSSQNYVPLSIKICLSLDPRNAGDLHTRIASANESLPFVTLAMSMYWPLHVRACAGHSTMYMRMYTGDSNSFQSSPESLTPVQDEDAD